MVVFWEMDSRISSCASAKAVQSDTIDDEILKTRDFSAFGRLLKSGSLEDNLSKTYGGYLVRHAQRNTATSLYSPS